MLDRLAGITDSEELVLTPLEDIVAHITEGAIHIVHAGFTMHELSCTVDNGSSTC